MTKNFDAAKAVKQASIEAAEAAYSIIDDCGAEQAEAHQLALSALLLATITAYKSKDVPKTVVFKMFEKYWDLVADRTLPVRPPEKSPDP